MSDFMRVCQSLRFLSVGSQWSHWFIELSIKHQMAQIASAKSESRSAAPRQVLERMRMLELSWRSTKKPCCSVHERSRGQITEQNLSCHSGLKHLQLFWLFSYLPVLSSCSVICQLQDCCSIPLSFLKHTFSGHFPYLGAAAVFCLSATSQKNTTKWWEYNYWNLKWFDRKN